MSASYEDMWGARHKRSIELSNTELTVRDEVGGFRSRAILRWRLRPGSWRNEGGEIRDGENRLVVSASVPIVRKELVRGWESRYYLKSNELPVLEVEIQAPGTLTSVYSTAR